MNDPALSNQVDPMMSAGPHPKTRPSPRKAPRSSAPPRASVTAAEIRAEVARPLPPQRPSDTVRPGQVTARPSGVEEASPIYDVTPPGAVCPDGSALDCDTVQSEMPGLIVGDCDERTHTAIGTHVTYCQECLSVLESYRSLDALLENVSMRLAPLAANPPTLVLPSKAAQIRRKTHRDKAVSANDRLRPVLSRQMPSPVGPITVTVSAQGVCDVSYYRPPESVGYAEYLRERGFALTDRSVPEPERARLESLLDQAITELSEYFAGNRDRFTVPVDLSGVTPFTNAVLAATAEVPFGHLTTYAGIAAKIGKPGAVRAVGNALGRNPVAIVVPCHRIVRSDWTIGGYTGGVHIKERLLSLEGARLPTGTGG